MPAFIHLVPFTLLNIAVIGIPLAPDLRVFFFRKGMDENSSSCKLRSFFLRPERYLRLETSIGTYLNGELDKTLDQSLPTVCLSISNSSATCFIAPRSRTRSLDLSSRACNTPLSSLFVNSHFL